MPCETIVLQTNFHDLHNRFSADYLSQNFAFMLNLMTKYCIETINLTHKFSEDETALNRVNLQVIEGTIYGFLGPNGAGKTTTLKLILGLLKKQQVKVTKENRIWFALL